MDLDYLVPESKEVLRELCKQSKRCGAQFTRIPTGIKSGNFAYQNK